MRHDQDPRLAQIVELSYTNPAEAERLRNQVAQERADKAFLYTQEDMANAWDEAIESVVRFLSDIGITNAEMLKEVANPYRSKEPS